MSIRSTVAWACAGFVGVLCLTGCPPKKKLAFEEKKIEQPAEKKEEAKAPEPAGIQINQDWTEIPQLVDAHFDFDKANLTDVVRTDLKRNVAFIKKLPESVTIRVEGHCDNRGTVEYNVALGQRRANAVRSYYVTAGIGKKRVETISFGNERPICHEETEGCWAQNRRGTTKVRNKEPITIEPDTVAEIGRPTQMAHGQ